jgi:predicted transcriptional regulator of viral defense system
MKYKKGIYDHFYKSKVFSLRDVRILFKDKNISKDYSKCLTSNLLKSNKINKITKGKYTFQDDIIYTGFAFTPFYYGLQEALSLYNLHEQETNLVIITTNKIKPGVREIMNTNVCLRRLDSKYFFGFDFIKYYDIEIPVSDIEKTLIDFVYYKEYLSMEVINNIKKKINMNKLNKYLLKYPKHIKEKVLDIIKKEKI